MSLFAKQPKLAERVITARLQSVDREYASYRKKMAEMYGDGPVPCPFCDDISNRQIVEDCGDFLVIKNDFPYHIYANLEVVDHLVVIPKRHIDQLLQLNDRQRADYSAILWRYHNQGYDNLTRSARSSGRSVPAHVHTHLIQTTD